MLALLNLLQTHRHWSGSELSDRLEVSLRTLRRDVDRLRELGYPVHASPGVDGGYQLAAGASLPPLVLDDEEAVALAVGLMTAAQSEIAGTAEASVRALTKVVQVMPTRLRRQAEALRAMTEAAPWTSAGPTIDPDALTSAAGACRDSERVRFGYTAAGGVSSPRLVEPHRLVSLGRRWYLVAYDLDRHDWRSFRLDRLRDLARTGQRFAARPLPAADAAEFVAAGIAQAPKTYQIEAVIAADSELVRARLGRWGTVEPLGDGECLLRMKTDSLEWPAMALGSLGAEFLVRTPVELREQLAEWADRFTRSAQPHPG